MRIEDHTRELTSVTDRSGRQKTADGKELSAEDHLVHEHFLEVSVNGDTAMRLSCTADHLKELIIGRLYTEGIIKRIEDIERLFLCAKGNIAEVYLSEEIRLKPYSGTEPTCCTGNVQLLGGAGLGALQHLPKTAVNDRTVFALAERFCSDSKLHRSTSGTHSCYLSLPEGGIVGFEDISRHNALDKAVGQMLLAGADPAQCIIYTTGRVPLDMVQKVIMARIPVLLSKSVPTDAAVEMAEKYGLQLLCKAWPDSYVQYDQEG